MNLLQCSKARDTLLSSVVTALVNELRPRFQEVLVVGAVNLFYKFYLEPRHEFSGDVGGIHALVDDESGACQVENGHPGDGDGQGVWQSQVVGSVGQEPMQGVSADSEPPRIGKIMPMLKPSRREATISSVTHTNRRHFIME